MGEFRMPSLGAEMESGRLVEWKVKPGDRVKRGDIVAVVDTDKAAIEVEVWEPGVVEAILVQPGTRVAVGAPLATIRGEGEAAVARPASAPEVPAPAAAPAPRPEARMRASPASRKRAHELGIDLGTVTGTGPEGAITFEDVEKAAKGAPAPASPDRQASMRRVIGAAMERAKREIPHYYLSKRVDFERAARWLEGRNSSLPMADRILPVVPILRAVVLACRKYPDLNGHWREGAFRPAEGVNLGVAVSLRQGGLIAPALLGAHDKGIDGLMKALGDLVARTRAGSIRGSELTEGTITVSNLGDGAETLFGVIYPPQVALVGIGAPYRAPVEGANGVEFHSFVNVTLSADHRVSDGHRGALFLKAVDQFLQEPEKL